MTPFEEFSTEIDRIATNHPKSRLVRWYCLFDFLRRRYWANKPLPFMLASADEGQAVGEPIEVVHMTMHDMMPHAVRGALTGKVLLKGLRVNAFKHLGFERLDDWTGRTKIQPCWV